MGSLEFLTDKFGDLSLQELESSEVVGSGTNRLPLALVRVCLACEAQLRHGFDVPRKTDIDPTEDKADHNLAIPIVTSYPIYQSLMESDSECGGEVYMVA
jgi:hypothetical protein